MVEQQPISATLGTTSTFTSKCFHSENVSFRSETSRGDRGCNTPNDQKGCFVRQFFLAARTLVRQSLKVHLCSSFIAAFCTS